MDRIGVHSKREIRRSQRETYARLWPKLVAPAVVLVLGLVFLHWILPDAVAPYVTAAVGTWVLCQMHQLSLDASGMTSRRLGIMAEQWTADELRKLDRGTWHVIHHVMLEHRDIDHVAIGPAGVIAVETKFRSSWERVDLEHLAFEVARQRRKVAGRARQSVDDVRCVVAMWGPDVGEATEFHDVAFCLGRDLADWLRGAPVRLDDEQRSAAVDALDDYVAKRDVGELREHGAAPASFGAMVNQVAAVVLGVLATMYLVASAARLPVPAFSIAAVVALISTVAWRSRRAWSSDFAQRLTIAILATALSLGALLVGVVALSALSA